MGQQVNFYMTESDEREFLQFVRSDRDVVVFMDASLSQEVHSVETLPARGVLGWFILWLWDRDNSPAPEMTYVPEQKHYIADSSASEVIEFLRSFIDQDRLVRGRIWAEMTGWRADDPAATFEKSESFKKWFDRLANWIKCRSVAHQAGGYLLPGAAAYVQEGGDLCQAALAKNAKAIHHRVRGNT